MAFGTPVSADFSKNVDIDGVNIDPTSPNPLRILCSSTTAAEEIVGILTPSEAFAGEVSSGDVGTVYTHSTWNIDRLITAGKLSSVEGSAIKDAMKCIPA